MEFLIKKNMQPLLHDLLSTVQYVPDIAMECHPPAPTHFILTPVRSSTRQGRSLVSTWPKPSWPRLDYQDYQEQYISKSILKGENSYWKRCFVVLQTSFWILQLYISGIYPIESTCVLILSEQICKQILKLIIKVMHTSNNVMNLCVD